MWPKFWLYYTWEVIGPSVTGLERAQGEGEARESSTVPLEISYCAVGWLRATYGHGNNRTF